MNLIQVLYMIAVTSSFAVPSSDDNYFLSEQEAVIAAANQYNPLSINEDREYMGAIYESEQGFRFTVKRGSKGSSRIRLELPAEDFDSVVAFWHTHGNAHPSRRYFSDVDTQTAAKYDRPFYLADYTGYLKIYEPGEPLISQTAARRLGLPSVRGYATGRLVTDRLNQAVRIATTRAARYS